MPFEPWPWQINREEKMSAASPKLKYLGKTMWKIDFIIYRTKDWRKDWQLWMLASGTKPFGLSAVSLDVLPTMKYLFILKELELPLFITLEILYLIMTKDTGCNLFTSLRRLSHTFYCKAEHTGALLCRSNLIWRITQEGQHLHRRWLLEDH